MLDRLETPVLFLIFKRPETTQKVFERIQEVKPVKLYVAADGPKNNKEREFEKCIKARKIATNVNWDCEIKTLFRDENHGCKYAISGAIDWFFEHEEKGIILEDDCVADQSFFPFCEKLLNKYSDKEKVMTIGGNNFQPKRRTENSYYFSRYMHCWGWAGWRRSWQHFDLEMKDWPKLREEKFLSKKLNSKKAVIYWTNIFDRVYNDEVDSWAYIWQYIIWKNNGLNILPEKNLVKNIGFGIDSTNTKNSENKLSELSTSSIDFPLRHPQKIFTHVKADKYTQVHHFQTPFYKKVLNKLKKSFFRLSKV